MRTKQPNDQQDSLTAVFEALSLHPLPARLAAAPPNSIRSACRQRAAVFSRPLSCSERFTPGTEIRACAAMQPACRVSWRSEGIVGLLLVPQGKTGNR